MRFCLYRFVHWRNILTACSSYKRQVEPVRAYTLQATRQTWIDKRTNVKNSEEYWHLNKLFDIFCSEDVLNGNYTWFGVISVKILLQNLFFGRQMYFRLNFLVRRHTRYHGQYFLRTTHKNTHTQLSVPLTQIICAQSVFGSLFVFAPTLARSRFRS